MPFKQHCFKGEGVLYFVYSANHRKCSKTFGRHCRCAHLQELSVLIKGSKTAHMPDKKSPPVDESVEQKLKLQWKEIQMKKHQEYATFKAAKELSMNKARKDEVPATYCSQRTKQRGTQTFTKNNSNRNNNDITNIDLRYNSNQNWRSHEMNRYPVKEARSNEDGRNS